MAAPDFEAIWVALLARITERVEGFSTVTRRPREQYGIEQYPVLELVEQDEDPQQSDQWTPPLYTASAVIGIVCRVNEGSDSPFTQINGLLKSVREALERQPGDESDGPGEAGHYTNLGALVQTLSVGKAEKRWGVAGGEAWAKIPIEVTTY